MKFELIEQIEQMKHQVEVISNQKRQLSEFLEAIRMMILPIEFEGFVLRESELKLEELNFLEKAAVCGLQEAVYC